LCDKKQKLSSVTRENMTNYQENSNQTKIIHIIHHNNNKGYQQTNQVLDGEARQASPGTAIHPT